MIKFCGRSPTDYIIPKFHPIKQLIPIYKILVSGEQIFIISQDYHLHQIESIHSIFDLNDSVAFNYTTKNVHFNQFSQFTDFAIRDNKIFFITRDNMAHIVIKDTHIEYFNYPTKIQKIAFGKQHCLALSQDQRVFAWGKNLFGALGLPQKTYEDTPTIIDSLQNITDIYCGNYHNFALSENEMLTWGKGVFGALGFAYKRSTNEPKRFIQLHPQQLKQMACGSNHTTFLLNNGQIVSCGSNKWGQLGIKGNTSSYDLQLLCSKALFIEIFIGPNHSFAISESNEVFAWGKNKDQQLGLNRTIESINTPQQIIIESQEEIKFTLSGNFSLLLIAQLQRFQIEQGGEQNKRNQQKAVNIYRQALSNVLDLEEYKQAIHLIVKAITGNRTPQQNSSMIVPSDQLSQYNPCQKVALKKYLQHIQTQWETIIRDWQMKRKEPQTIRLSEVGIPTTLRKIVWSLALPNHQNITRELFEAKLEEGEFWSSQQQCSLTKSNVLSIKQIEMDIKRTNNVSCQQRLRNILIAFTCHRSDIGYVQGMNYIAAHFLMHFEDEYEAFRCFTSLLTPKEMLSIFNLTSSHITQRFEWFSRLLALNNPILHKHFQKSQIDPTSYLLEWVITLYAKVLTPELTNRIWDMILLRGPEVIWRTAIGILKALENDLLSNDLEEIYQALKSVNKIQEEVLMRCIGEVKISKLLYDQLI